MPDVAVSPEGHKRIRLLARAWSISEGEVISRLLDQFQHGAPGSESTVEIFGIYQETRVEAVYHTASERVDVTTGELAGQSFKSPSGAACAVVAALNPDIAPNRNGWTFWFTEPDRPLQCLRGHTPSR
ncbi:DUF4357 domain-containing protein [Amycolatopsis sp. cg5]|uniref:DUF4357 domain-containing protein n=1 Tax=Amycolatopsis sp. cg5 TaxID=3238802 RepID=UPI003525FBDE